MAEYIGAGIIVAGVFGPPVILCVGMIWLDMQYDALMRGSRQE